MTCTLLRLSIQYFAKELTDIDDAPETLSLSFLIASIAKQPQELPSAPRLWRNIGPCRLVRLLLVKAAYSRSSDESNSTFHMALCGRLGLAREV